MSANHRDSANDIRQRHRAALRLHAFELLRLGHERIDPAKLTAAEEEQITGWLKEGIEEVIEISPHAPPWVRHYTVYDEEKPSGTPTSGKCRPRIDITIKRSWARREPHPRFRFEAKRLKADGRVAAYFGKEGIGCFLRGIYPLTHPAAAMIGYVQHGSLERWARKLEAYARKNAARLGVATGKEWQSNLPSFHPTATSRHATRHGGSIDIDHLLLLCH